MTEKVLALDTKPGIQRDGTIVDATCYTDGEWVRFQRGRPRKMAGYVQITNDWAGPSRGLFVDPRNGFNVIYNGYSDGVQTLTVDQNGVGAGIVDFTLSDFTASSNNLWQFDAVFDASGTGVANLIAHPGQNLTSIDSTTNTPVLFGPSSGTTLSQVGVFTLSATLATSTTVTVASTTLIGAGQTITGTNIPLAMLGSCIVLYDYSFNRFRHCSIRQCSPLNLATTLSSSPKTARKMWWSIWLV